jgi:hypothetical protein
MESLKAGRLNLRAQILALLLLFTSGVATAQEYRGRIQGVVTDSSGAVIVAASVTLLNVNTNATVMRQTDEGGKYLFDLVEPGAYTVTIEAEGSVHLGAAQSCGRQPLHGPEESVLHVVG